MSRLVIIKCAGSFLAVIFAKAIYNYIHVQCRSYTYIICIIHHTVYTVFKHIFLNDMEIGDGMNDSLKFGCIIIEIWGNLQ